VYHALAGFLIAATFVGHLLYIAVWSPIDLSGDEAYYWEWSRRLDIGYYSKGPLIAYLIRASSAIFGDTVLGVRFPTLILSAASSGMTYWLAGRLLGSAKAALIAVGLLHLIPFSVARGVLMTIDSPLFFFWAAATCMAYLAMFEERRWAWGAMGLCVGLGVLTKFSMGLWLIGLAAWPLIDERSRRWLRTRWPYLMLGIIGLCALPVVVWNFRHGWVTVHHVADNAALRGTWNFSWANVLDFWTGQLGVVGPVLFPLFVLSIWQALAGRVAPEHRRAIHFMLCIGLGMVLSIFMASLRTNPGANWVCPAYFTLVMAAAVVFRERWSSSRAWRGAIVAAVMINGLLLCLAYQSEWIYRPAMALADVLNKPIHVAALDPTARVKGLEELGKRVSREAMAADDSFILAHDYSTTALLAFYVKGQPRTYCVGPYLSDPKHQQALSQYDLWDDRRLDQSGLVGRSAIYVGPMTDELREAFESVRALEPVVVERRGVKLRTISLWRCRGFKGMRYPATVRYWRP
jgi:undecaprenyl-diphosphatase